MRSQDILMMKRKELGQPITTNSDVESLIIIDRASDLFTPMCSQLTYQGPAALSFQLQTCEVFIEHATHELGQRALRLYPRLAFHQRAGLQALGMGIRC
jgi:hypothetical protein